MILEVLLPPHRTAGNHPDKGLKVGTSGEKSENGGSSQLFLEVQGIQRIIGDTNGVKEPRKVPVSKSRGKSKAIYPIYTSVSYIYLRRGLFFAKFFEKCRNDPAQNSNFERNVRS